MRLPISIRLTLWYAGSLVVLLSLFVVFLYTSFHFSLHRDFDAELVSAETQLRSAISAMGQEVLLDAGRTPDVWPREMSGPEGTFVRLLDQGGNVLYESENFAEYPTFAPTPPKGVSSGEVTRNWNGVPARTRYAAIESRAGAPTGWLEVTRLESSLHRELHRLRWLLIVGILLGSAVSAISGYGLARRALRPVSTIIEAARSFRPDDRGKRLPTKFGVRDELTDLAETLNALLERVDRSLERERRFRADAAHEILTPVTAVKSEIDVALRRSRSEEEYRSSLAAMEKHVTQLSTLVGNLLRLSRAEAGNQSPVRVTNLVTEAQSVVDTSRIRADAKGVNMLLDAAPASVLIDSGELGVMIENLVDNAIKYTPHGGRLVVSVHTDDRDAVLRIADTGIGFDASEAPRLFDRFYRANSEVVQKETGSGLGLSIAAAIARSNHGHITAHSHGRNRGSTFEIRLPAADPDGVATKQAHLTSEYL